MKIEKPKSASGASLRWNKRDEELLKFLGEYGCVSAGRIKAKLWGNSPMSCNHYRRLSALKKENLVETVIGDGRKPIGYRLTQKGRRVLSTVPGGNLVAVNRRSYKTQFEHDQILIDLRNVLELSPVVKDFQSEAEIMERTAKIHSRKGDWKQAPPIPDALFIFEVPGQKLRVALELELSQKSRPRYRKILTNHLLSQDWDLVLYVVKDDEFLTKFREIIRDVRSKEARVRVASKLNGIYLCSLASFQRDGLTVKFTNEKKEFSLTEIAKNFGLDRPAEAVGDLQKTTPNHAQPQRR